MVEIDDSSSGSIDLDDWTYSDPTDDDDSGSSTSSTTTTDDRYTTSTNDDGSYNVPSGYVGAANQGDQTQSEQLEEIEEATEGNIDKQTATLGGDDKADDALTVETDQNEVVTATPTGGTNEVVSDDGNPWGDIPKKALLGAAIILFAVITGGR